MASQDRLIFVNLPVNDLAASQEFFGTLGFEFNPKFTNENAACMIVSDKAYVMLLDQQHFAQFTRKPTADGASTEVTVCVSADDRESVDAFAEKALGAGAGAAREPVDYGFMYGRSFYDLDGHHWEVMWMSPEAVEAGPEDYAAAQQSAG